jgi:hypothetical protein
MQVKTAPAGPIPKSRCRSPAGCSASGHDVDPVDVFRLTFQARLDAAYQLLDVGNAEAIVKVDPGHNPYAARTDEAYDVVTLGWISSSMPSRSVNAAPATNAPRAASAGGRTPLDRNPIRSAAGQPGVTDGAPHHGAPERAPSS